MAGVALPPFPHAAGPTRPTGGACRRTDAVLDPHREPTHTNNAARRRTQGNGSPRNGGTTP